MADENDDRQHLVPVYSHNTTYDNSGLSSPSELEDTSRRSSASHEIRRKPVPVVIEQPVLIEPSHEVDDVTNALLRVSSPKTRTSGSFYHGPRLDRIWRRIGWLAASILIVGTAMELAALSFLTFLWYSGPSNQTWHSIAVAGSGWMTRAVSLTALCLRTSLALQASVLTAMLAGIALEATGVLAVQVVSISTMRNANSGPFWLSWQLTSALTSLPQQSKKLLLPSLTILLFLSGLLTQLSSTALLSDLDLRPIPGKDQSLSINTNYVFDLSGDGIQIPNPIKSVQRASAWTLHPPFFPTFAEYATEPRFKFDDTARQGVRDTGTTLRAFLPFEDQQSRHAVNNYTGRATVLDSSVVCMRPKLESALLHPLNLQSDLRLGFVGQIAPSVQLPELHDDSVPAPYVSIRGDEIPYQACLIKASDKSLWGLNLCQVTGIGNLASSVTNATGDHGRSRAFGASYLALNLTTGTIDEWNQLLAEDSDAGITSPGFAPVRTIENKEWTDLIFDDVKNLTLSVSLCYSAFDSQDLFISAYSDHNRTEPTPVFDRDAGSWRYDNIRRQLGQASDGSFLQGLHEQRGILQLQRDNNGDWFAVQPQDEPRPDWISTEAIEPNLYQNVTYMSFLLHAAKMEPQNRTFESHMYDALLNNQSAIISGSNSNGFIEGDGSARFINWLAPDATIGGLIQEILMNGGDIAHAVQSAITVMSGLTYYDQLPQFNGQSEVHVTSFQLVLVPVRHRGFIAVVSVTVFEILLGVVIITIFVLNTTVSSIGNAWQSVAQINTRQTREVMEKATLISDDQVTVLMGATGKKIKGDENRERSGKIDDPEAGIRLRRITQHVHENEEDDNNSQTHSIKTPRITNIGITNSTTAAEMSSNYTEDNNNDNTNNNTNDKRNEPNKQATKQRHINIDDERKKRKLKWNDVVLLVPIRTSLSEEEEYVEGGKVYDTTDLIMT